MLRFFPVLCALVLGISSYSFAATITQDSYFVNLNTIKFIQCISEDGPFSGTGFVIGKDRVVTANHVIYGATSCVIDHKPAKLISHDVNLDIAVLRVDLGPKPPVLEPNCDGFVLNELYLSFGWAQAQDFAMTKLMASGEFEDVPGNDEYPFKGKHFSVVNGLMFSGMSGGPIIDMNGRVVGINNLSDGHGGGLSRALADTAICAALHEPDEPLYPMPPKPELNMDDLSKLLGIPLTIIPLPAAPSGVSIPKK